MILSMGTFNKNCALGKVGCIFNLYSQLKLLKVTNFFFSEENGESTETGNTSEHQGRLTEILNLWINDFGHNTFSREKNMCLTPMSQMEVGWYRQPKPR